MSVRHGFWGGCSHDKSWNRRLASRDIKCSHISRGAEDRRTSNAARQCIDHPLTRPSSVPSDVVSKPAFNPVFRVLIVFFVVLALKGGGCFRFVYAFLFHQLTKEM